MKFVKDLLSNFFKEKENNQENLTPLVFSASIQLKEIKDINDLKIGDVVLHKNIVLYKIIGFGKVQIADQWFDTINYKQVFKTTEDQIFTRRIDDFLKSFKKVEYLGESEIRIKDKKN